jgi:hypothetical protein
MKRDMNLVRAILVQVEANNDLADWAPLSFPDRSAEEVSFHVCIMAEGGLLEATDSSSLGGHFEWHATRLTWAGCEFLDTIRNDTVWKQVVSAIAREGGPASFAIVKALAFHFLKQHFKTLGALE